MIFADQDVLASGFGRERGCAGDKGEEKDQFPRHGVPRMAVAQVVGTIFLAPATHPWVPYSRGSDEYALEADGLYGTAERAERDRVMAHLTMIGTLDFGVSCTTLNGTVGPNNHRIISPKAT
jgi:hypothetical protein